MNRMSRAGRKLYIRSVLRMAWRNRPAQFFSVGEIAKKMGLKSSTYLKNVLREMEKDNQEIVHSCFDGVDRWKFQPYEQMSFLASYPSIKINGKRIDTLVSRFEKNQ